MTRNTLILGLAAGYHYGDVRPFLASLDRTGYTGERVLFISETTRNLDRMRSHQTTLIPVDRSEEFESIPYNGLRYFDYLRFLEASDKRYERILITDVRDVIFKQTHSTSRGRTASTLRWKTEERP